MRPIACLFLLLAAALAQDGGTAAEKLFQDAWWQETAQGALDKALAGYRAAAAADGPAATRARALYRAALLEQRLGRTDEAIRTLERLAQEFPGEKETLDEAKARLAEWTAVDLRKSFSEWYRRYVFSPEFQSRVVELVLKLGASPPSEEVQVSNQLLTIGEAAVPALEEALKSSNERLQAKATWLLLRLGAVPPAPMLQRYYDVWCRQVECLALLLGADEPTRRRLREEATGEGADALVIRALATSPEAVYELALSRGDVGIRVFLLHLLRQHGGPELRRKVERVFLLEGVPDEAVWFVAGIRDGGPEDADLAQVLAWSRELPTPAARQLAVRWACVRLTPKDAEVLDGLLAHLDWKRGAPLPDLARHVLNGLASHKALAALPWTPERAGVLVRLYQRFEAEGVENAPAGPSNPSKEAFGTLAQAIEKLQQSEPSAVALLDAILGDVASLERPRTGYGTFVGAVVASGHTVHNEGRTAWRPWYELLAERATPSWAGLDVARRLILLEVFRSNSTLLKALLERMREDFAKAAYDPEEDPRWRVALLKVLRPESLAAFLATFDLGRPEECARAVAMLEQLSGVFRNVWEEKASPALCAILLCPAPGLRPRMLQVLHNLKLGNASWLLPAAKELLGDPDLGVRSWALGLLRGWKSFEAAPFLERMLKDENDHLRAVAAQGLAEVARSESVPALVALLEDPSPTVREAALKSLEAIRRVEDAKKHWKAELGGR